MIDNFLEYAKVEKRYSPHTVTSYKKDLEDFRTFYLEADGNEDIVLANSRSIKNFIVFLSKKHMSKRSINRKLSTLRSFYLFCMKTGAIENSPLENVASLKFYAEKQVPASNDEMKNLKIMMKENSASPLEIAILETLYQTGIRKAELCQLKYDDLDVAKKELKVLGKGIKERIIPISDALISCLQPLFTERPVNSESYLFLSAKGKKLNEKFVYSTVKNYLSLITSKEQKSPHILRHTFATHLLNNGAEISKVKKLMGHASLASTQVYTNADIEQLKKVFNSAHPRAKKD